MNETATVVAIFKLHNMKICGNDDVFSTNQQIFKTCTSNIICLIIYYTTLNT